MREIYMWSQLRHPNVQELLGIIVFQDGLGMVSPWMEQGNLQQYIEAHPEAARHPFVCATSTTVYPISYVVSSVFRLLRAFHIYTVLEWFEKSYSICLHLKLTQICKVHGDLKAASRFGLIELQSTSNQFLTSFNRIMSS